MTDRIIEYDVIVSNKGAEHVKTVQEYIDQGWQPLGGVCFNGQAIMQAIVRYDEQTLHQLSFIAGEVHEINHKVFAP